MRSGNEAQSRKVDGLSQMALLSWQCIAIQQPWPGLLGLPDPPAASSFSWHKLPAPCWGITMVLTSLLQLLSFLPAQPVPDPLSVFSHACPGLRPELTPPSTPPLPILVASICFHTNRLPTMLPWHHPTWLRFLLVSPSPQKVIGQLA